MLQAPARDLYTQMMADFRNPGYKVSTQLYRAAAYEVPQMRERVFIVGTRKRQFAHPEPELDATEYATSQDAIKDLEQEPEHCHIAHVWSKAVRNPEQGDRRLKPDVPATTIRAEHHGNVQWHYALNRRISLREAARLQSFPDAFEFNGGMRETERQIGNAVPPVLAWHIAKAVREHLES